MSLGSKFYKKEISKERETILKKVVNIRQDKSKPRPLRNSVGDSESSALSNPGWRRGIRVGSAITGHVLSFIPDPDQSPGGTSAAEGVAADKYGNIYGAEVGPRQLVRYVREN